MASVAPITPAAAREPGEFRINGCDPFNYETADNYICAAHAVACAGEALHHLPDGPDLNKTLVAGVFNSITILLSLADRICVEKDV